MVDAGAAPPRYDVLLVDDGDQIRRLIRAWLEGLGLNVVCASTGEQALEVAQACTLAVVLTDYELPGLAKVELVRALKAAQPGARLLVMSGAVLDEVDFQMLGAAGMDRFLHKPLGCSQVQAAVLEEIGGSRAR